MLSEVSLQDIAGAYERGARAWSSGPDGSYRRFAEALVAAAPSPLAGAHVLDVGAGTGAVSVVLNRAGVRVTATDSSSEMLRLARESVPGLETAVADAARQPFDDNVFDGAASGFCINHLPEPHLMLAECARVVRPSGFILASTFAGGDDHPAKVCVEQVARDWGWEPPAWEADFRSWSSLTDSADGLASVARVAGLDSIAIRTVVVNTGP